jgi:hypothetical protein
MRESYLIGIPELLLMGKGQAAVEYLTTYGWVILILLIVIGFIMSSGVLTPGYMISEECSFGNILKCNAVVYNQGGHTKILLTVFNGYPYKVQLNGISLKAQEGNQAFPDFAGSQNITSGGNWTYSATLSGSPLVEGTVKRFTGNLTFVSCAPELGQECSTVTRVASGRVTGRVVEEG